MDEAERERRLLALLGTHDAALRRIARVYGSAAGDEEDLHQEMLLQLWSAIPGYRGEAQHGTWLYRVALNTALTWRRSGERRRRHDEAAVSGRTVSPPAPRSEAAILEEFLASLNDIDRSVLLLYMEALSNEEIAEVTGMSTGAVGVRLHRIRKVYTDRYVES
jgi:RNA polymerase sigma-70 factor, ECF subfamily